MHSSAWVLELPILCEELIVNTLKHMLCMYIYTYIYIQYICSAESNISNTDTYAIPSHQRWHNRFLKCNTEDYISLLYVFKPY